MPRCGVQNPPSTPMTAIFVRLASNDGFVEMLVGVPSPRSATQSKTTPSKAVGRQKNVPLEFFIYFDQIPHVSLWIHSTVAFVLDTHILIVGSYRKAGERNRGCDRMWAGLAMNRHEHRHGRLFRAYSVRCWDGETDTHGASQSLRAHLFRSRGVSHVCPRETMGKLMTL